MPVMTQDEKDGYDAHVASAGNPHGAKLSELGAPDAAVDLNAQALDNVGSIIGTAGNMIYAPCAAGESFTVVALAATHNFDIPVTSGFFAHVVAHIIGVDQSDSSRVYRKIDALVVCASATAAILGDQPAKDVNAADSGSIFDVADSPYGDPSVTGANFRLAFPSHASHAVKYTVNVEVRVAPIPA